MMERPKSKPKQEIQQCRDASGLGVPCAEAQADGVPCPDLSRDCEHCERGATAERAVRASRKSAKVRA